MASRAGVGPLTIDVTQLNWRQNTYSTSLSWIPRQHIVAVFLLSAIKGMYFILEIIFIYWNQEEKEIVCLKPQGRSENSMAIVIDSE